MGYCTYITRAGYELQAKLFAEGGDFHITRVEVGRGVCPPEADPALLTGLGIFDKLAKRAGAGTLVPITGFANAVVSPAIEFKSEGLVLGLGAKMFIIAGPVIVYGVTAAIICGLILFLTGAY